MAGIRKAVLITINKISSGVTSDNQISKATAVQSDIESAVASRDPIRKSKVVATGANAFYTDGVLYKFFDLSDIVQNVSDFSRVVQFFRDHLDEFTNSDVVALGTLKPFSNEFSSQDDAPIFSIDKTLENVIVSEELISTLIQFNRQFSDDLVLEEVIVSKSVGSLHQDTSSTTDDFTLDAIKSLQDVFENIETATLATGKNNLDDVESFEIFALAAQKQLEDINGFDDVTSKAFIKIHQDISFAQDQLGAQPTKVLQEEVTLFDQINTLSNFDKTFDDTHQSQSEGFLVAQNYTIDNTYFLEDYVGQSATFT